MSILCATSDPLVREVHEHEICERVYDLGAVVGGIVVLNEALFPFWRGDSEGILHTSSHQLIVLVTGSQKPGWSAGGYGKDGSQEGMMGRRFVSEIVTLASLRCNHPWRIRDVRRSSEECICKGNQMTTSGRLITDCTLGGINPRLIIYLK